MLNTLLPYVSFYSSHLTVIFEVREGNYKVNSEYIGPIIE